MPQNKPRSVRLKEKLASTEKTKENESSSTLQKLKIKEAEIQRCFNAVAGSEEGRIVFRELARLCSFRKSKVVADIQSHTIHPVSTTFNAAQENIYLQMTKRVRREYLIKIEYPLLKQEE